MSPAGRWKPVQPLLRVLILGNSTAVVVGRKSTRLDGRYGDVLERLLRQRGIEAIVTSRARPWDLVSDAIGKFMEAQHTTCSDVVVINFGLGECEPIVIPRALMRWTNDVRWVSSFNPIASRMTKLILPRVLRFRVWLMPRVMPRLGMRTFRLSPARFEAELTRLMIVARNLTAGLVLVLTPHAPSPFQEQLLPSFRERAALYERIMRRAVARANDPNVMIVEAGAVVEKLGWRRALSDGLHFSAEGHFAVATLIEDAIVSWLAREGAALETRVRPDATRGTDELAAPEGDGREGDTGHD